jgi:hypothetical protein
MESLNKACRKAAFTLKQCLQHAQVSHPIDAISMPDPLEAQDAPELDEELKA